MVKEKTTDKEMCRYEYYNGDEYRDNKIDMIEIEIKKDDETKIFSYATNREITEKNMNI